MSGLFKKKKSAPAPTPEVKAPEPVAPVKPVVQAPPPPVYSPPRQTTIAEKKREERLEREEKRAEAEEIAESQRLQRRKRLRRRGGMRMLFSPLRREGPGYGRRSLLGSAVGVAARGLGG